MRRVLSEIRETAAGGQKLVAEALVMIAAAGFARDRVILPPKADD
jgi:hypothetical protein